MLNHSNNLTIENNLKSFSWGQINVDIHLTFEVYKEFKNIEYLDIYRMNYYRQFGDIPLKLTIN